ncbi:MAG: hypothetical protein EOS10_00135 [Mesorhizobium sp.]|uniref:hypothetical protein n=1 Tax=Mesorhizobium sp. TaxID=1871066 RepID=UPI000FE97101|nr:hypothetical protein [Mesorhizobium sp.]RWO34747.1 MAG: hypothetical protein EOS10_00135 [Mesorhizobium sp.]
MAVKQTAKIGEGKPGPGRPKGVPNKTTQAIKDAVQEAFEKAGGVNYLVQLAKDDPRTFCGLIGRVIPLQVEGNLDSTVTFKTVYEVKGK